MIIIEQTGPQALIEDLGRPGYAALGISPSGAADRAGLCTANRLVGNPENTACIETTFGGLEIRASTTLWCAVAGAPTTIMINNRPQRSHHTVRLLTDDLLSIESPPTGLRNYLAVRGGIGAESVLGSRSTDLLGHLGPAPLRRGDRLPIGHTPLPVPDIDFAPVPPSTRTAVLRLQPGPRADWFTADALESLTGQSWRVGSDSDRTAVRLEGVALRRRPEAPAELPSEGVIRGAVQVPPSGQPLIFGSNHPVTGGYPVIAVVAVEDVDRAAQLRPGDELRLSLDR